MTTLVPPAPDAPAEEWGRLAMRIPGWCAPTEHLSGGMPCLHLFLPDPDHWMWEGWFLRLLSPECHRVMDWGDTDESWAWWDDQQWHDAPTLGRACIAAAEALGRWPGDGE